MQEEKRVQELELHIYGYLLCIYTTRVAYESMVKLPKCPWILHTSWIHDSGLDLAIHPKCDQAPHITFFRHSFNYFNHSLVHI